MERWREEKRLPWEGAVCPVAERTAYKEAIWISHHLLLGSETDVDQIVEAIAKIQANVDELLRADHQLIKIKEMNRAERPRYENV